jgi:hypothetical protein
MTGGTRQTKTTTWEEEERRRQQDNPKQSAKVSLWSTANRVHA